VIRKLRQAFLFLEDPRALRALLSWPTFSVTSYRMLRVLERKGVRPKTVIDVGANVGQFTVAAAETFGALTVHAFEPLPTAAAEFRRHTAGLRGVTLHEIALGDSEGTATLRVSANSVSSSLLPMRSTHRETFPESAALGNIEVAVTTLDRALAGAALVAPVLLKVDAQGYEARVLRGASATRAQVEHVLVETSLVPLYEGEPTFTELIACLGEWGFVFEAAVGFLESPKTGELLQLDALFRRG
jgi:FkbM family methyltransferase